ncbi:unnamed protein product [Effrenium voratum]|nr:unnamed protein product [Effrenium voratum]
MGSSNVESFHKQSLGSMADTPHLCFKPPDSCVHTFSFNHTSYTGCTTVTQSGEGHPWCSHVPHFIWGHSPWSFCLQVPCENQSQAALFTPAGMQRSVMLNLLVVVIGLAVCTGLHCMQWAAKSTKQVFERRRGQHVSLMETIHEADAQKPPQLHSTGTNYLMFLKNGRDMFFALTIASLLIIVPNEGIEPFLCGCVPGPISIMEEATSTKLGMVTILALVHGITVLIFGFRYNRHCAVGHHVHADDFDLINRTLWLTHLPNMDFQKGEPFTLKNEELEQVKGDLLNAIMDTLKAKNPGQQLDDAIEAVHVVPVVTQWHALVQKRKQIGERKDYYGFRDRKLAKSQRCCKPLLRLEQWWVDRQLRVYTRKYEDLQWAVSKIDSGTKQLSGSAFVTFQTEELKKDLAGELPSCLTCRTYSYWSFGRPPFSSVTLRCHQAPHPSNVNWCNLQVPESRRVCGYITGRLFLLVFMLLLVTPVAVTSELNLIVGFLKQHSDMVEQWLASISDRFANVNVNVDVKSAYAHLWEEISEQVPTITLVLINSLVLPPTIGLIADFQKFSLKSQDEKTQLRLNYFFLVVNQIAIPLLGISGIPALVAILTQGVGGSVQKHDIQTGLGWAEALIAAVFSSPAAFAIKYLLNCAFMTSTNSLMNLPQLVFRFLMGDPNPWEFSYGYWYAFSIGIIALGFGMGIYVPSLLPCAAMFFFMRYFVDKYNIGHGVYSPGVESLGSFSRTVRIMLEARKPVHVSKHSKDPEKAARHAKALTKHNVWLDRGLSKVFGELPSGSSPKAASSGELTPEEFVPEVLRPEAWDVVEALNLRAY